MIINGLSPGVAIPEPITANLEKEKVEQEIFVEQQALKQSQTKEEPKKEKKSSPDLELNEYYLKELLFLMSSRGNSATIEKLAQLLRKERDTISTKVK